MQMRQEKSWYSFFWCWIIWGNTEGFSRSLLLTEAPVLKKRKQNKQKTQQNTKTLLYNSRAFWSFDWGLVAGYWLPTLYSKTLQSHKSVFSSLFQKNLHRTETRSTRNLFSVWLYFMVTDSPVGNQLLETCCVWTITNPLHNLKLRISLIFLQMLKHVRRIRFNSIEIYSSSNFTSSCCHFTLLFILK